MRKSHSLPNRVYRLYKFPGKLCALTASINNALTSGKLKTFSVKA